MNKEQFAEMLNGREYPFGLTRDEVAEAKQSGLVVVYGASDDLMEIEGAIRDEVGCYNGGKVKLNRKGVVTEPDDDEAEVLEKFGVLGQVRAGGREIQAIWGRDDLSWQYATDIPHATFTIMEDGETYCRGIVFELKEVS